MGGSVQFTLKGVDRDLRGLAQLRLNNHVSDRRLTVDASGNPTIFEACDIYIQKGNGTIFSRFPCKLHPGVNLIQAVNESGSRIGLGKLGCTTEARATRIRTLYT
jgi:hypothetical protein